MTTAAERLDEAMEPPDLIPGAPTDRPWSVTDVRGADWALRKLAKLQADLAEVSALAEQQMDAIREWQTAEERRLAPSIEFFQEHLARYHRHRLEEDPKAKTIRLPHGVLLARKRPDGIEIEDRLAFIEWALKEHPDFVRMAPSVDRDAVKDAVLKQGEAVPGVWVVSGEVRYTADTAVKEAE